MTPPPAPPLEVFLLGLVDFDDVQRLQRRLAYEIEETGGGALILCEHPPTISIGRHGSRAHIRPDDEELRALRLPVRWVARGGGCLLHLPGQLNGYLALPLRTLGLDLGGYLRRLEAALLAVLGEFDLKGGGRADPPGVYLGNARVGSLGVSVHRWVAGHGFTLNVGPYLGPFAELLEEPGPGGLPLRQTSMEAVRQRPAAMAKVRESALRHLEGAFGLERHHLYTDHPLIRRKATPHVYAQSLG